MISYEEIVKNEAVNTYIKKGNELLGVLGITDHSAAHAKLVSEVAGGVLFNLGYPAREVELAKIAGYLHDIGNVVNRVDHAQTGAIMAFTILSGLGADPEEICTLVGAIGNHDEGTGSAVSAVSAALILADKGDVRRSRVRNTDFSTFDIHDRVNYAVETSELEVNCEKKEILLKLKIDDTICPPLDYFEIFLARMLMCRRAADFLGCRFSLVINGAKL